MYTLQRCFLIVTCIVALLSQSCTGRFYIGYDRTDQVNERRQMNDHEGRR